MNRADHCVRRQHTKQLGEHLGVAEICRRGMIATTFTGSVPHYDIVASAEASRSALVQVKAINGPSWQFCLATCHPRTLPCPAAEAASHAPRALQQRTAFVSWDREGSLNHDPVWPGRAGIPRRVQTTRPAPERSATRARRGSSLQRRGTATPRQHLLECLEIDRLREVRVEPGVERAPPVVVAAVAGDGDEQ